MKAIQLIGMAKGFIQSYLGTESRQQHSSENNGGIALSARAGAINTETDQSGTARQTDSESESEMSKPKKSQRALHKDQERATKTAERDSSLETLLATSNEELEMIKHHYKQSLSAERKLQKEVDQLNEENKRLSAKTKKSQNSWAFLDGLWSDVIKKYLRPYENRRGIQPEKWTEPVVHAILGHMFEEAVEVHSLRDRLRKSQGDVRGLQDQLQALQSEMLTRVVKTQVTPDDQFAQGFRNIAALVKTLSRMVRPDHGEDLIDVLRTPLMLENVAQNHLSGRTGMKTHIEAWTWCVLLHLVFRYPFAIFGKEGQDFANLYTNMFQQAHCDAWPCPTTRCEIWRYTTMEQLAESIGRDAMVRWETHTKDGPLSSGLIDVRAEVLNTIEKRFSYFSPSYDLERVRLIINKAFALSMTMSLQVFRLQLTYPKVGDRFNADTMTALPNDDGDDMLEGVVAFVVNPGLTKWGDAHGKNLDHRYDIVPSVVQLAPSTPMTKEEEAWSQVVKRGRKECNNKEESQR